jgi:hypothetical protein
VRGAGPHRARSEWSKEVEGAVVSGRVVDHLGQPVLSFEIRQPPAIYT